MPAANADSAADPSIGWPFRSLPTADENDTSCASPSELVQAFDADGFLCLSSVLTPHFVAGLREECMEIFDGVLGWLREAGATEFRESCRRRPIDVPDAQSSASSSAKYEYPLGIGLKHGYRELVMRSPGRYEMALLVDDFPGHLEGVHIGEAAYNGKWLLGTKMFDRNASGQQSSSQQSTGCVESDESGQSNQHATKKSCLKQLLEWIQNGSIGNESSDEEDSNNLQHSDDRQNMARFMKVVDAVYPPSSNGNGCRDSANDSEYYLCNLSLLVATPGCPTQSWHADGGHVSLTQHQKCHVFNVFVPLVDVPISMGPTELRPGTHYHTRNLAPMMLAARARKTLRAPVAPEMRNGDALLFDYRILHRGRANASDDSDPDAALDLDSEKDARGVLGKDRPVLVMTFARIWFSDVVNFPKRSIFATQPGVVT
ncbi:hypothetical protein ACHAXT_013004 [Thalassiosira profunda]